MFDDSEYCPEVRADLLRAAQQRVRERYGSPIWLSASQINDAAKLMADGMPADDAYLIAYRYGDDDLTPWQRIKRFFTGKV